MYLAETQVDARSSMKVTVACVEGNHHAFGAWLVASALTLCGCDVQYTGANTPTKSLIDQVKRFEPETLYLSLSLPIHVLPAIELVEVLKPLGIPVAVGGIPFSYCEDLISSVGADAAHESVSAALEVIE